MNYKRIFAVIAASMIFLLSSCTKEEKTYSVTYNGHYSSATIDIFEFDNAGEPVKHVGGTFYKGKTREFTAQSSATKVKVHVELPYDIGWVQHAYSLSSNHVSIVIDDNTNLGAQP